jgi:hypothetical protein
LPTMRTCSVFVNGRRASPRPCPRPARYPRANSSPIHRLRSTLAEPDPVPEFEFEQSVPDDFDFETWSAVGGLPYPSSRPPIRASKRPIGAYPPTRPRMGEGHEGATLLAVVRRRPRRTPRRVPR